MGTLTLGIDVACKTSHQASLADEQGMFRFVGRRFVTASVDLEALWHDATRSGDDITVVLEPTRNAWVPLAAWFRRRGARVVLVPPEQSADLRAYYSKHTKSDRLDSKILARLPMLHPDGLGPGDPLRRLVKIRSSLVRNRTTHLARIDAQLEILGPDWFAALGGDLARTTALRFLAAGYADPNTVKRLGAVRLGRFIYRHSRGRLGDKEARMLVEAAEESIRLWSTELDFSDLADDIALHARLTLQINVEIKDIDDRVRVLMERLDPTGIITSAPGVAQVTGSAILGRLGDPSRFRSLAGVRSYTGLTPSLDSSGVASRHGAPTKQGDAVLREAIFMAADHARRVDPQLAAKYHRLMVKAGKHHTSALCNVAMTLLTRIVATWRRGEKYVIRDCDGRAISMEEGRAIVLERFTVPSDLRREAALLEQRRYNAHGRRASRRGKESTFAPSSGSPRVKLHRN